MTSKTPRPDPSTGRPPIPPVSRAPRFASEPVARGRSRAERWEPGFLRLPAGRPVRELGYLADLLGAAHDATARSELERLLQEGGWEGPDLIRRAEAGIARLRARRLSVRNGPGRRSPPATDGRPRVVVVDQRRGDPAVGFGLAGADRFPAMLAAAIAENPDAEVQVVLDPAAPESGAPGHLLGAPAPPAATFVPWPVEPWSAVEGARRVYAVSAHLGWEALMAGVPVTLFGAPFYAGWGLTDDRLRPPRRTRPRSTAEVFAAAYLLYSRWFDPHTGAPIAFEQALDILELAVARARENDVATLCVGFAPWKRESIASVLGWGGQTPSFAAAASARELERAERVVSWASREPPGTGDACRTAAKPLWRMEDGFIRSIGLGVALRAGASHVLDRQGVYYDATRPSDLENLLETAEFAPELLARAARLREAIVSAALSKYNVGSEAPVRLPQGRPVVLVAGQVENDASLRLGAATTKGNAGLLQRVRERHPDALIAYKPHPDVEAGLRPGRIHARKLAELCDVVLRDCSAPAAIAAADRVEVATSLLGFEALLRGKPVTTHGLPFYAGWGLTDDPGRARRTRRLSLDELVAGALILHPRYVDPVTDLPCEPELLVRRLAERAPALARRTWTLEGIAKTAWSASFRAGAAVRR